MYYKALLLKIVFFVFIFNSSGQLNRTSNWHLENYNGINTLKKEVFNSNVLESESIASISDTLGNLLLYTDGLKIWNKYDKLVKNGDKFGFSLGGFNTSLRGVIFSTVPENDSIIYLFYNDYRGNIGGLNYLIVNLKGNNDSCEVISKNNKLISPVNESITSTYHQNGKDIWICVHSFGGNLFYNYLVTKNGLNKCPVISKIGYIGLNNPKDAQVILKFSPNGKYLCHTIEMVASELFDFNNLTGVLKNNKFILNNGNIIAGIEFSPNSKFIYLNERDYNIYQYDIFNNSILIIKTNNDIPIDLQLSLDHKIYIITNNSNYLKSVNFPDIKGLGCNLVDSSVKLNNYAISTLPNFNQSYFYTPSINYSYEMDCINNSIQFEGYDTIGAVTHQWQTKKLYSVNIYTSIANTKNTTQQFADTGTYLVRYIADNGNRKDTVVKTITMYPKIKKDFLGKDTTIAQGSVFNIQLKSPQPSHCQEWHFERLNTQINKGSTNNIVADSIGKYICKTTNQAFCEIIDTLIINECINNLTVPSIYRNLTDTLFTYQPLADSFVWYRNNQQIAITKQPFIKVKDTGTYRVEAAKKGHCNRSSNTFYINKLGVKHYTLNDFNIKVYPNPSNGIINIESDKEYKLKVTDLIGRTILETENQKQVELTNGVYYFMFEVDGYVVAEKVIVL